MNDVAENNVEVISPENCTFISSYEIHLKTLPLFLAKCNEILSEPWRDDERSRSITGGDFEKEVILLALDVLKQKGWRGHKEYHGDYGFFMGITIYNPRYVKKSIVKNFFNNIFHYGVMLRKSLNDF